MANLTTYFVAEYDTLAGGSYTELSTTLLSWDAGSSTGFIINDIPDTATTGKLICALVSGVIPTNGDTLTQGGVTSSCAGPLPSGNSTELLYPAYFRRDVELTAAGAYSWDTAGGAPAIQATHSFLFDGQTSNVVATEILTFSPGGQQCEVIEVVSDAGVSGELDVRWITPIDTLGLPDDNDTFTGDIAGDGALNGVVHDRSYSALHLHRLSSDLSDDPWFTGDDILATYKPTPSSKDTDAIINLLGSVTITDEISQHMYGGSIKQGSGITEKLYSGLNIQITDSDGNTEPVLIQADAVVTSPWWANTLNPNSIQGDVRMLLPTRESGTDIDGKRIKGKLLRYGDTYFTGSTTLGTATTALALFSATDNNNQTAEGTVAGAPYNTIVQTQGYQTLDFSNGSGATPFGLSIGFGSATSKQTYERTKYNQRENSAETIFGRNCRLLDGFSINFAYNNESGAGFNEGSSAEILAWGAEVPYTGQAGGNFAVGNVIVGAGGARGRILYDNDTGTAGTLIIATETGTWNNTEALTEYSEGVATGVTATSGTVVNNTNAGTLLLMALNDAGATGNIYGQLLQGVVPASTQTVFGATTLTQADVNGAVSTRVINNQYVGSYTGTNYLTNFGVAIAVANAIAGDLFPNLLGNNQTPPDNRTATVTGLESDYYVTIYPWNGAATDSVGDPLPTFAEMTLNSTVTSGVSTSVDVGTGNIPDNTPQTGWLRIERDTDNEYFLWAYTAHNGDDTFTMSGTAPYTATAGNDAMRAPWDALAGSTQVQYSAVLGTPDQYAITAKRGGTSSPIKPAKATATFPYTVNIQAQSDA